MIPPPLLDALKQLAGALPDAFAVVDRETNILDFNRTFYSLFSRHVARQLKQRTFRQVFALELAGQPLDIAQECMSREMPLRYDEVVGRPAEGEPLDLIATATPLVDPGRVVQGVFITLRNVTDEAQVQTKYKSMLEEEAREREVLQRRISDAESELVVVKDQLAEIERELLNYKKGLLI